MTKQALALLLLLSSSTAMAAGIECEHSSALIGRCYWIWGSFGLSADNADTLDRDQPFHGIKGITVRGYEPKNLVDAMEKSERKLGYLTFRMHGRFKVCPIQPDADRFGLPWGCIQSASHLSLAR
jgi:hypothetical protein